MERGDENEPCRDKTPAERNVATPPAGPARAPGALADQIKLADDFDVWPDDIARALGLNDSGGLGRR